MNRKRPGLVHRYVKYLSEKRDWTKMSVNKLQHSFHVFLLVFITFWVCKWFREDLQQQKKLKSKVQQIFIGLKTDVRLEVATGSCVVLLLMHGSQTTFFQNGPSRPLFVYFRSFLVTISIQNGKKRRWCAWDSNQGPQNGRRRWNHGAMAATLTDYLNELNNLPNEDNIIPSYVHYLVIGVGIVGIVADSTIRGLLFESYKWTFT